MHKKYLTKERPVLADGDFMGLFLGDEVDQLTTLIKEGIAREEEVFLSSRLMRYVDESLYSEVRILEIANLKYLNHFVEINKNKLQPEKTGFRFLLDAEEIFSGITDFDRRLLLDQLLQRLMCGELSIGAVYFDLDSVKVSELASFPRVYVNGKVVTNKFFVMPNRAATDGSELSLLFEDTNSQANEFSPDHQPYPMGVPDMLESIIESMGVGIVVGDRYGNMVLFNKASSKMMGLPPSPLPYAERIRRFGNYLEDKVTPFPFDKLPLSRAVRGENFDNELIYVKNSNKPEGTWIQTTGRGVRSKSGELIGGVLVSRDITEEHRLQEENDHLQKNLVQNQKLESLGVLAGGIAHDFNNLLVGVLGNASIVLQQNGVVDSLRTRVEQIQQAGFQLSDLTKQLLIYAGINPSQEYQEISLNSLVNSMAGLVEAAVSKKMIIETDLSKDELVLKGDEIQLRQILLNLAINAADAYGHGGGELFISTSSDFIDEARLRKSFYSSATEVGDYICFEVRDQAGGIDREVLSKVFDPFFSTKGFGRGLGLSAVLGIVKAHKGFLELETEKGHGTIFRVWFKSIKPLGLKKIVNDVNQRRNISQKTILLVDDEELVLEVADSILSFNGMQPIKALSGLEGLKLLKEHKENISLLILDMNMPDMNGEDVYKEVRKIKPDLPVVISSGFSKELCSVDKFQDDNCYFLEKPYSVEKLLKMVNEVVG